jgi:hypothetical protein
MTRRKDTISVSSEEEGFAAVIHRARNVELKFRYEEEQSSAAQRKLRRNIRVDERKEQKLRRAPSCECASASRMRVTVSVRLIGE